ncbi:MAG: efflux RND transporter periplasmic adaptor subunit [Pelovirga sp.]
MKKRVVGISLILGAVVAVTIAVFFWLHSAEKNSVAVPTTKKAQPPTVRVTPVTAKNFAAKLALTGTVEPVRIAQLASTTEGVVKRLLVREGDQVGAKTLLASIVRKDGVQALIDSLTRELAQEEENLQRLRALVDAGALPAEQLEQADIVREKIRVQLINAREAARDYDLYAPWSGIVSRVHVKEGELVVPRVPLVEIYDPDSLIIQTAVPERYAVAIATDMAVTVKLDAYPGEIFSGQIVHVFPQLDVRLRSRLVEIALDQSLALLPGMFARLDAILESVDDAPGVPVAAVLASPQGPVVFIINDGRAVRRKVETGIEEGGFVQIRKGVDIGDVLVIAGAENLKDGAAVTVRTVGSGQSPTKGTE